MTVHEVIKNHIVKNYLNGEGGELNGDTELLELNIIDSAAIFALVHFLRSDLGVTVPIDHVTPENFESINKIALLVERSKA